MYHDEFFNGDQAAENASYEFNAQFDYLSELRAEHHDQFAGAEDEYYDGVPCLFGPAFDYALCNPMAPKLLLDDEIPF